jgi:hypothetical protein
MVREWVSAWGQWQGPGEVIWRERRWRTIGFQRVPERLIFRGPDNVAAWILEEERWVRAVSRYRRIVCRWPSLAARLPRHFEALSSYSDADMDRLESMVSWIEANPCSNLYTRQIPLAGMDTKWLDGRMPFVADLVAGLRSGDASLDFHQRCGLREAPKMIRLRLLDRSLQSCVGGLSDIIAPIEEIARLPLRISRAYIIENVQTGLCFEDLPGAAVFLGLGYGVNVLGRLPWLAATECFYWGDLDTHGFAILSQARTCLTNVASALMDESTLLRNREFWVEEKEQFSTSEPLRLTDEEQAVYRGLKEQLWGNNVRLEQERIPWNEAWRSIVSIGI